MLTLKELKGLVMEMAGQGSRCAGGQAEDSVCPITRNLQDGQTEASVIAEKMPDRQAEAAVIAEEVLDGQTEITVFGDGKVRYRTGRKSTVFWLRDCGDYTYRSQTGTLQPIREDLFEGEAWYIRLLLEGEERLAANQERVERRHSVPYDAGGKSRAALTSAGKTETGRAEKEQAEEEVKKILGLLTPRQGYVLMRWHGDNARQSQIAAELGVSQQAVADMARKAKRRIYKEYGNPCAKNKRKVEAK